MNILVVQTGFIGDVILSTPVLYNLSKIYPSAKITLLTTKQAAELMQMQSYVSEVIIFDKRKTQSGIKGMQEVAQDLASRNFSQVFSLHKSYRTAILLYMSGIKIRFGFKDSKLRFLYSKTAKRIDQHEALRNLSILTNIGFKVESLEQDLKLSFNQQTLDAANKLLENSRLDKLIGIAPGSVWKTKRWTAKGFAESVKYLLSSGYEVVLLGGPDDIECGIEIEKLLGNKVLNLIGQCSLPVSAAIISKLKLLVSNDSAPMHIASALKVPTVAIFCATVPEFGFGPWKNKAVTVGLDELSCRPCSRHGNQSCPTGTDACRIGLKSEMVIEEMKKLL